MASPAHDGFDGYRKWLGIAGKNRPPTHYELLAVSLDEDDPDVIRAAADQRRGYVESKRGTGRDALVTEIVYRINEAETTLLDGGLRRDYDRRMRLFEKRAKSRQVDPVPGPRGRVRSGKTVGEDSGIVPTFAWIVGIITLGCAAMAFFSFGLKWADRNPRDPNPVAQAPAVAPLVVPVVAAAPAPAAPMPAAAAEPMPPPAAAANAPPESAAPAEVALFDGNSLDGWEASPSGEPSNWSVRDGVLRQAAEGPSLLTSRTFDDFDLHLEFKLPSACNSGVYLRGRYEVQLIDADFRLPNGRPVQPNARCGAIWGQAAPTGNAYRGPDEWNALDVRLVGRVVTVKLNGETVVDAHTLTGTTGKPVDKNESAPGGIMLQSADVAGAEFRNVRLTPIPAADPPKSAASAAAAVLQGEWRCVASEEIGRRIDAAPLAKEDRRVTFEGNRMTMMRTYAVRKGYAGTFTVDAATGHFDFAGTGPDGQPVAWLGIYELAGDTLKLCYRYKRTADARRPTEFKTDDRKPNIGVFHVYKRT